MGNLNQAQKVKYAVLNAPYLIPVYFKPPYNPTLTNKILNKMVNRMAGIEIECFGSLVMSTIFDKDDKSKKGYDDENYSANYYEDMAFLYGIDKYHEDCNYYHSIWLSYKKALDNNPDGECFNEHQIRIKGYKQLIGLYNILEDMKRYCILNPASGIHIHLDLAMEWRQESSKRVALANKITKNMDKIEQIFYPGSKYIPNHNYDRSCNPYSKGSAWVSIRDYNSVEFRLAPMSFEYTDIVRWIVECTKLLNSLIGQPKIKGKSLFDIKWRELMKYKKKLDAGICVDSDIIEKYYQWLNNNDENATTEQCNKFNNMVSDLYTIACNIEEDRRKKRMDKRRQQYQARQAKIPANTVATQAMIEEESTRLYRVFINNAGECTISL